MTTANPVTIPQPVPLKLRAKHRLAISSLAGPIEALRYMMRALKGLPHPELALLRQENRFIRAILRRLIKPDWNCLDIGGHLGSVSYQLRKLAPQGDLTIIEASPGKAAMLRDSFPGATVLAVAVSNQAGDVSFFENLKQPGFSSLANRSERGATQEITVQAYRLDDLLAAPAHIDFIKIDVEGFEFPALQGGMKLLQRCKPTILFEAGAIEDQSLDTTQADALFDMLTGELGYDVYAALDVYYERAPLTRAQFKSYRTYPFIAFNYFALPRNHAAGPADV